jgi:hypothetical protein
VDESSGIEVGRELKIHTNARGSFGGGLTPIAQFMRGSARPATGACHPVATPNSMSERSSDRPAKVGSTATAILDPSRLGPVSGGA